MTEYVPFKLDDNDDTVMLIEVSCNEPTRPVYRGDSQVKKTLAQVGEQAKISLSSAMDNVRASATVVLSKMKEIKISEQPSKIELEFGIKLDATAGAVIAQAGTEVNYTVKLTWESPQKSSGISTRVMKKRSLSR